MKNKFIKRDRKEYNQKYYQEHQEYLKQQYKLYYQKNRKKLLSKAKKNPNIHKKHRKEYEKIYRLEHKKEARDYQKIYQNLHKEKLLKYRRKNYILHKEYYNQYDKNYKKNRKRIDINYRLRYNLRTRIWKVLKGITKSEVTMKLVGCSIKFLRQYLESLFKSGMSWENYGTGRNGKGMQQWHIDHIKPCASFDLSKPSEQRKCFHYTNLQPLWAKENLEKRDKIKQLGRRKHG